MVVFSRTGKTGIKISKYRPRPPVLVVTREESVAKYVSLCYGVETCVKADVDPGVNERAVKEYVSRKQQ